MAPHPGRSDRPGGAVALLYLTLTSGGPDMAPNPRRSDRPGGAVALLYSRYFRRRPTSGGAEQAAVLGHHAAVLHDANAGARQRLRRAVVADAQLEPDDRGLPPQPDALGRLTRQELWATEHPDDPPGRAQGGERAVDPLAEAARAAPRRV